MGLGCVLSAVENYYNHVSAADFYRLSLFKYSFV
jgi:hypothetical protein